jgi:hypothetical protein
MSAETVTNLVSGDPVLASELNVNYVYTPTTTTGYDNCNTITTTGYTYWPHWTSIYADKTKAAFAVAKKLMALKVVKITSIDKFVKLVETIEAEL